MSFADFYFSRYNNNPVFFTEKVNVEVEAIVVIPCFDDEFIFQTLESLKNANRQNFNIEVIVVINSSENTSEEIVNRNREIYKKLNELKNNYYYGYKLLNIILEKIPKKKAGVGYARKTGMDEAVRHFNKIDKKDGIILSLDADTLVKENYFEIILKNFKKNNNCGGLIFGFQHNYDNNLFSENEIKACKLYEKYLNYYTAELETTGFPYYFHTIGSCFGITGNSYVKVGGMPCRQAGEDFYFLHKLAQTTKIGKIDEKIIFPSPRISNRVPFGTGPTINQIIKDNFLKVYNHKLFEILKDFFNLFSYFYLTENIDLEKIPQEIINFVEDIKFLKIIDNCKNNSSTENAFIKRMFSKFDAFWIIKFLNSFNEHPKLKPERWILE
ncbi:MAG: glycosyltransferase family 2 protein [Bacteroidales bacterium]|jgi:hypothetical protein|nr:glycosyltransferase family 2 protein [Bacteroidales bacterium]